MTNARVLLPTASGRETRETLRKLLGRYRLHSLLMVVALLGTSGVALLGPLMMGEIVDRVVDGRGASSITTPVVILVLVAVGDGLLTALGFALLTSLGETMLANLREQVVDRALRLPLAQIEEAGSGDLASRVGGDVSVIANAVRNVFPTLIGSLLTILMTIGGLALLDWRFALAGLCAAPVQIGTLIWYLHKSTPLFARERVLEGERAQKVLDAMEGARTVRALNLHDKQAALVEERSLVARDFNFVVFGLRQRFFARVNLAEFVGLTAILVTGFFLVRADTATIGATTAAALFFHRIFDPVSAVLLNFDEGQNAASGLARLVGIARMPAPEVHDLPPVDAPSVAAKGVDFSYMSGHKVLDGVDFEAAAGERVALVGASGAGKTTLAKLLAGIHEPQAGEVDLGGIRIVEGRDVTGRVVALITQEVHVFSGTLAEDLRLARPGATDDELRDALRDTGALTWVDALVDGLRTRVGEGAHRLTASQAQQLALTRLILMNPPIAILDEATAEAGSSGARVLERAADAALRGRTSIVVAHRLTQARQADRIVMLENGRVVETGTHDELVAAGGAYAALWAAWSDQRDRLSPSDGSMVAPK
ncbi:MAG: ABC transporter ATP-binding protein [Dehalococcoidia bacterium]